MGALLGQVQGEPGRLQGVGAVASGPLWHWFFLCSQGRSEDGEHEREEHLGAGEQIVKESFQKIRL